MAKRFTDTEKWRNPWYRKLPWKMKLLWSYICDTCDIAGIWYEDLEGASFAIGEEITREEYNRTFGKKLVRLKEDKVFFPQFVEFQYGKLSPKSAPNRKVIQALIRNKIDPEPFISDTLPTTLPDRVPSTLQEEEEVKEEAEEQEEAKAGGSGGISPSPPAAPQAPGKPAPLTREDIHECEEVWKETLRKFKTGRSLLPDEQTQIGRAIQRYGKKAVILALEGARHEKKSESFDPSQFATLKRVLDEKNFTRFLNLGVQAAHRADSSGPAPPGLASLAGSLPRMPRDKPA